MSARRLVVDGVGISFGGVRALEDVSIVVGSGEVVGVIGPNGAGKTTLFNLICGFVRPDTGTISYAGQRIDRVRPERLAALGIARTLQAVRLFPSLTVLENVMTGFPDRRGVAGALLGTARSGRAELRLAARARRALSDLGLARYADRYPVGLPFGVQKGVALARALLAEPTLLLLDEPASGLSAAELAGLGELLGALRDTMSVLIVEHNMELVMSVCDRLAVLDFGRLIASGTPAEVRADPLVAGAYLGTQTRATGEPRA